jgi:hypothetical protein
MQAVRLARYHTRRTHLVRFCGAYHGWWGDVQPGRQPHRGARDLHAEGHGRGHACGCCAPAATSPACWSIRCRRCTRNAARPATRRSSTARARALRPRRLHRLARQAARAVCSERGIVLIFDEVFVGFRLAPGGAQEYFGVRADMVTYGKTLGGGLPVGVVCGRRDLMKRFREDRPADICFARGTFNSHPYVMGAMHEFLQRLDTAPCAPVPRSRRRLEFPRARLERTPGGGGPAGAGRKPVHDLDRLLPGRRATTGCSNITCAPPAWPELGGHGAPHLQPELHGRRLCRGRRQAVVGGSRNAARGLVVVPAGGHQQVHPARVFKEMLQARWASTGRPVTSAIGSMSSPRSK